MADEVSLAVRVWGGDAAGGVPFLLVHGLASNARIWDGLGPLLGAAAAVDLRGHGESDKPAWGYDFPTVVADLVAVLSFMDLDRPVVVGQSWGGNVVMELAAAVGPSALRGIACVDGGWITLDQFESAEEAQETLRPPSVEGMSGAELEKRMRSSRAAWPEPGIQGALACYEFLDDGSVAPRLSLDRHLSIVRAIYEQDLPAVLKRVEVPVLLLPCDDGAKGTERKRAEVAAAEAALRVSRTHWFCAEHDVHAARPDEVAGVLLGAAGDGFFS